MIQILRKKTNSFYALPFKFKCLFFINYFLCGIARFLITSLPLKRLSTHFGRLYKNNKLSSILSYKQQQQAIHLRRSIQLAARYTPWNSNCLTQAMVAKFWCQQLNIPYIFYIGFAKDAEKPNGYAAHAWLTAGPVAITGKYNSFSNFHVISTYIPRSLQNIDN
jgi:hypothetical protein